MISRTSRPSRRSSLLLIELIIAILFFCLCAGICIQLFVKSHIISQDTRNLNMALNEATTAAEIFRGSDDPLAAWQKAYPDGKLEAASGTDSEAVSAAEKNASSDSNAEKNASSKSNPAIGKYIVCYDSNWEKCDENHARFYMELTVEEAAWADADSQTTQSKAGSESVFLKSSFTVSKAEEKGSIYQMETGKYIDGRDAS